MDITVLRASLSPDALPWVQGLLGLLALMVAAATLEGVVISWRRPGSYDWRAFFSSFGDAALRHGVNSLGLGVAAPVAGLVWTHRLGTLALDSVGAWLLLFVGLEFCYYGYHRAAHRVRWFWATHAVHHSPNQLSLATAARLGFTGKLTGTTLFFMPLVWLGFHPAAVFLMLSLNLLYQFWIHATWIPRLWAPIEWLFNTPSHHRVHHGSNAEYLDCNYGGVLIVFDRLFGTFVAERDDLPPRYGLTTPLQVYNPLRIGLHEWLNLARDLRHARSLRDAVRALFGPPGAHPASPAVPPPR